VADLHQQIAQADIRALLPRLFAAGAPSADLPAPLYREGGTPYVLREPARKVLLLLLQLDTHPGARATTGRKDPVWERTATLQGMRYEVATLINAALEREGHAVAVSHASLRTQGHDRSPERVHARADAVLLKKYGWEIPAHLSQHQQDQLREIHDRWKATLATRETISRDFRGWENDMNVLAWDQRKKRDGLRDISREAVLDHSRDRFWAHDHSQARTQERDASLVRAIDREYTRTGRERPQEHAHSKERVPGRQRVGLTLEGNFSDEMQGGAHVQLQEREYA